MWDMCQMLNIWHIYHTKHKKQLPSNVAYVPKLYHLCPYCCKFATIWINVVKQNNVLYLAFSLLSLPVLISSLSLFSHQSQLPSTKKEQNDTPIGSEEKQIIFMGEATPIGSSPLSSLSEAQAAWARPLRSDHRHRHRRRRHKQHGRGHSDHPHRHRHHHRRSDLTDLSLSLFWWLVVLIVVGWLILVDGGRLIGLWVWDLGWSQIRLWIVGMRLGCGCEIYGYVVFVWVFFFW